MSMHGRPLMLDPLAASADPNLPAFLARPADAPVYHGFRVLPDIEIEGFKLGMITELENQTEGDAFVVAPDDSRAGLVWEISDQGYFTEVCPLEAARWGVWVVAFPHPMSTRADARRNLEAVLPRLKERWETWRRAFTAGRQPCRADQCSPQPPGNVASPP